VIVHLNGAPKEVLDGATVGALIDELEVERARRGVAVAVGGEVVPRAEWDERVLADGARVEVVHAVQGG
jgi:sulfur carrier protein